MLEILGKLVRGDFTGAAKQAKQMIDNYSDIATGIIADAMGEKKKDVVDFIGESMYRLFHCSKDYFEQNGIQKPIEANAPCHGKKTAETALVAADYPTSHALMASKKKCAEYVNNALRAQGIKIWGHGCDVAGNLLIQGNFKVLPTMISILFRKETLCPYKA